MAKSAVKFKDSVAEYERIAAEIAARRFSGIYLLMGEEADREQRKKKPESRSFRESFGGDDQI